jgi:hypothetical protein
MIEAVFLMLIVAIAMALLVIWTRDLADLLWMFAARRVLVGGTSLLAMTAMLFIVGALLGVPSNSATTFALAILITPTIAKWVANRFAYLAERRRLAGDPEGLKNLPNAGGFVFAQRRRDQAIAYEVPRVAP